LQNKSPGSTPQNFLYHTCSLYLNRDNHTHFCYFYGGTGKCGFYLRILQRPCYYLYVIYLILYYYYIMLISKFPLLMFETTEKWELKNLKNTIIYLGTYCKILL